MEYTLPINCSLIDGVQSMTSVSYFGGGGVSVSGRLLLLLESYSMYGGGTSLGFCGVAKDISCIWNDQKSSCLEVFSFSSFHLDLVCKSVDSSWRVTVLDCASG